MLSRFFSKNSSKSFIILFFCSTFFHFSVHNKGVKAQISPDGSLPTEVDRSEQTVEINGGAKAGNNLFHSFEAFSVSNGQEVFFNNAADINNIISRVTGNSISEIDGLIRANGSANLFLLNSNGIIFGPNASLKIGGSFLGTTAESLIFEDEKTFDTKNSQAPLLSVDIPIGLQIGSKPGSIVNRSVAVNDTGEVVGLEVNRSQDLTLIGGEINLEGGYITAPGGQVNLGGLSAPERVSFTNSLLNFGDGNSLANVSLSNGAEVNVRSDDSGGISIDAKNLSLTDVSYLLAGIRQGSDSAESKAGDIDLNITETATIADGSFISNSLGEESVGEGGNVNIKASSLFVTNNSGIASITDGKGDAGDINIEATDSISIISGSLIQADTYELGDAGDINIEAENADVFLKGVETAVSSTVILPEAIGNGGNINVKARNLTMTTEGDSNINGALLQTSTFGRGNAGNIVIQVDDTIDFKGAVSGAFSEVGETGIGQGGDIDIQARSLSIKNGASIFTGTGGRGDAGNINITASDSLVISGTAPYPTLADNSEGGFASLLYTATDEGANGQGGAIAIDTNNLQLSDGAAISGRSRSSFRGGNITVNTKTLEITSGGQILTTAFRQGRAGDITLNVSDNIDISGSDPNYFDRLNSVTEEFGPETAEERIDSISAESGIYANTTTSSTGDSGNISINSEQLNISDEGRISVATLGNGDGGNIFLQAQDLLTLRDNSRISATAGTEEAGGDGGNITIDTDLLIASPDENSDITANAFEGRGGFIEIFAEAILGFESRTNLTRFSDITAFSEQNPDLNGVVRLDIAEDEALQELTKLPTQVVDASQLVTRGCSVDNGSNQFVVTGKGGLAPSPTESLRSSAIRSNPNISSDRQISRSPAIVEAQSWMVNEKGNVVLTANPNNRDRPNFTDAKCPTP